MPTFLALQCFNCQTYQVVQEKKVNKWSCKLCNEKQSVRIIFARSDQAKDIRGFIQERNAKRGVSHEVVMRQAAEDEYAYQFEEEQNYYPPSEPPPVVPRSNRWSVYEEQLPQQGYAPNEDLYDDEDLTTVRDVVGRGKKRKKYEMPHSNYDPVDIQERRALTPKGRSPKRNPVTWRPSSGAENESDPPLVRPQYAAREPVGYGPGLFRPAVSGGEVMARSAVVGGGVSTGRWGQYVGGGGGGGKQAHGHDSDDDFGYGRDEVVVNEECM